MTTQNTKAATPGPWKVRKQWHGGGKEVYPDRRMSVGSPSEICTVSDIYDECAANARLIAQAPALLEQLVAAAWQLERDAASFIDDKKTARQIMQQVDRIRAAIAAATGEA